MLDIHAGIMQFVACNLIFCEFPDVQLYSSDAYSCTLKAAACLKTTMLDASCMTDTRHTIISTQTQHT